MRSNICKIELTYEAMVELLKTILDDADEIELINTKDNQDIGSIIFYIRNQRTFNTPEGGELPRSLLTKDYILERDKEVREVVISYKS